MSFATSSVSVLREDQILHILLREMDHWPAVVRQFEAFDVWLLQLET